VFTLWRISAEAKIETAFEGLLVGLIGYDDWLLGSMVRCMTFAV
jgi:hypothetical protein